MKRQREAITSHDFEGEDFTINTKEISIGHYWLLNPSNIDPPGVGSFLGLDGNGFVRSSTTPVGPQGPQGPPGNDATINVGATTTLMAGSPALVTNTGTPQAAILNFAIPQGFSGTNGGNGAAATISVGTTSTLPSGSSATVGNSGSSSNAIFDFGIPQGIPGTNGTNGTNGNNGTNGTSATITVGSTTTLAPGNSAVVVNSGTPNAAILNFGIPEGLPGTNGTNGTNGSNGTNGNAASISVGSTTTLSPGTGATVTNSGSSSAAIFNFGIPQGLAGTNGTNGTNGAAATITAGSTTTLAAGSPATVNNSGSSAAAIFNFGIPAGINGIPTSISAFGSTPNANGMTLVGSNLNLEYANASFGGSLSNGAQTIGGTKTFPSGILLNNSTSIFNTYVIQVGSVAPSPNTGTITSLTVRGVAQATVDWSLDRIGNVVTLRMNQFTVTAGTGFPSLISFTNLLPASYRPSGNFWGNFVAVNGSQQQTSGFQYFINTAGTVQLFDAIVAGSFVVPYGLAGDLNITFRI